MKFKSALQGLLSEDELRHVRRYEVIGDIAIVSIPDEIENRKAEIADVIRKQNKSIKTVLQRLGGAEGVERVHRYEILYGDKTETLYRENGCIFHVDPTKVYVSPRMNAERTRLLNLAKDGEGILCAFAGIGLFPVVLARHLNASVYAVEISSVACEFMERNIKANSVSDKIRVFCGDAREVLPEICEKFDRVIMPTPKGEVSERFRFLKLGMDYLQEHGTMHYYTFASESEIKEWRKRGLNIRNCGSYAPSVYRIVIDVTGNFREFDFDKL
jgi:tRNA (guanine37-N1)-methyltransferase